MIDRTSLDLRIAEHTTTTARINRTDWQQHQPVRRPLRAAVANALVTLAARLDPATGAARQPAASTSATPA
jgi:hypothetical protein